MSGAASFRILIGDLVTQAGERIPGAVLATRILGDPAVGERHGWTVVVHALTGNEVVDEWWEPLVGAGRSLDPDRHPILTANLLGGCHGSTGPRSWSGRPEQFPRLAPADLAVAHLALLEACNVRHIALLIGGSLGGMVALELAQRSRIPIDRAVILAAPARASARAIGWSAAQRLAMSGVDPATGLRAARAIAMLTYRGRRGLEQRFGSGAEAIESWLAHHGDRLVARFDPESYRVLLAALDRHDLGDLDAAAWRTAERVGEVIGVGIDSDILYTAAEVRRWVRRYRRAGVRARYREIRSPHGHDAFLLETGQVAAILAEDDPTCELSPGTTPAPGPRPGGEGAGGPSP